MYDLIMFDLDGTLTLPEEGITKSVQYALESFGIIENDKEMLKKFIGPPLVDAFSKYYNLSREDSLLAVEKYRERFREKGIYENELIKGVPEMLSELKDNEKIIALATSKPIQFAKVVLKYYDLYKYFDIIVGAEFDGTRNDKADVIEEVLRQAKKFKNPVMIGDREHDCIGASKHNVDCIGVLYGYGSKAELIDSGAKFTVKTVNELKRMLLR